MEVVQAVQTDLRERIEVHKETKSDEPLVVSGPEVRAVLENAGVSEEKLAGFQVKFDETFGDDAALSPRNLVDSKRMQLKTPDVIIHVAPDRGDLVETRTLGGVKYIMVRAEDGVELNGVDIQIDGGYSQGVPREPDAPAIFGAYGVFRRNRRTAWSAMSLRQRRWRSRRA